MRENPDDIVRAAVGPMVQVEVWQQALTEAGIESRVVGTDLSGSFGTVLSGSVELWVHSDDLEKAEAAIARIEKEKGHHSTDRPTHERVESEESPRVGEHFPGGAKFNTGDRGH